MTPRQESTGNTCPKPSPGGALRFKSQAVCPFLWEAGGLHGHLGTTANRPSGREGWHPPPFKAYFLCPRSCLGPASSGMIDSEKVQSYRAPVRLLHQNSWVLILLSLTGILCYILFHNPFLSDPFCIPVFHREHFNHLWQGCHVLWLEFSKTQRLGLYFVPK